MPTTRTELISGVIPSPRSAANGLTTCKNPIGIGYLVDTQTDPSNCGACGSICPPGVSCTNGSCDCVADSCSRRSRRYPSISFVECVDFKSDTENCGKCGVKCPPGLACCGGVCTDSSFDSGNCGSCGNTCPAGHTCDLGICKCDCPVRQDCCGPAGCYDLNSDVKNCGKCGIACPSGQSCCGDPTGPGVIGNYSECKDLTSDAANCGRCGAQCPYGQYCEGGVCKDSNSKCNPGSALYDFVGSKGTKPCGTGCASTANYCCPDRRDSTGNLVSASWCPIGWSCAHWSSLTGTKDTYGCCPAGEEPGYDPSTLKPACLDSAGVPHTTNGRGFST